MPLNITIDVKTNMMYFCGKKRVAEVRANHILLREVGTESIWNGCSTFEQGKYSSDPARYAADYTPATKMEAVIPRTKFAQGLVTVLVQLAARVQACMNYLEVKYETLVMLELGINSEVIKEIFEEANVAGTRYLGVNTVPYVRYANMGTPQEQNELLGCYHTDITVELSPPDPTIIFGFLSRVTEPMDILNMLRDPNIKAAVLVRRAEERLPHRGHTLIAAIEVPANAYYQETKTFYTAMEGLTMEIYVSDSLLEAASQLRKPVHVAGASPAGKRRRDREFGISEEEAVRNLPLEELRALVKQQEKQAKKAAVDEDEIERKKLLKKWRKAEVQHPPVPAPPSQSHGQ
jgi:hypothetical protein